ncbi:hypothetical protein V2I01_31080 [Micromonospora sp. BRA006-A]|nr:hypothetical protein [Micromonospora sp. BRA006-A]
MDLFSEALRFAEPVVVPVDLDLALIGRHGPAAVPPVLRSLVRPAATGAARAAERNPAEALRRPSPPRRRPTATRCSPTWCGPTPPPSSATRRSARSTPSAASSSWASTR